MNNRRKNFLTRLFGWSTVHLMYFENYILLSRKDRAQAFLGVHSMVFFLRVITSSVIISEFLPISFKGYKRNRRLITDKRSYERANKSLKMLFSLTVPVHFTTLNEYSVLVST